MKAWQNLFIRSLADPLTCFVTANECFYLAIWNSKSREIVWYAIDNYFHYSILSSHGKPAGIIIKQYNNAWWRRKKSDLLRCRFLTDTWHTTCMAKYLSKTYALYIDLFDLAIRTFKRPFYEFITLEDLQDHMACDTTALVEVIANFPMGIKPNFILFLLPLPF